MEDACQNIAFIRCLPVGCIILDIDRVNKTFNFQEINAYAQGILLISSAEFKEKKVEYLIDNYSEDDFSTIDNLVFRKHELYDLQQKIEVSKGVIRDVVLTFFKVDDTCCGCLVKNVTEDLKLKEAEKWLRAELLLSNQKLHDRHRAFVNILEDLKEERKVLELTKQELTQANAELEQFVNLASHDLQEPLRTIEGFALRLKNHTSLSVEKMDVITRFIEQGVVRMQQMVQDVLTYSKIDISDDEKTEVDLNAIISSLWKEVLTQIVADNGARLVVGHLPKIYGLSSLVSLLFQNLFINAIKYKSDDRNPEISVTCFDKNDFVVIAVSDNGKGIHVKHHKTIFEIFKRLERRNDGDGTGIGLAFCKKIMSKHAGYIELKSEPGKGSEFLLHFPRRV